MNYYGATTPEMTALETANTALARRAAAESFVLLKNEGQTLPLTAQKIALCGMGARKTVKGGEGSGDCNPRQTTSIEQGLENAGFTITSKAWLDDYDAEHAERYEEYRVMVEEKIAPIQNPIAQIPAAHSYKYRYPSGRLITPADVAAGATDTALYVLMRQAGEYLCWIKQSGEEACFLILQADAFTGPYTIVKEAYRPRGYHVGDFDIAVAGNNAYLYMDADHAGIVTLGLSADFLSAENEICWQYKGLHAPFCREAPAVFARGGKTYLLTSGMTGYIPNRSDSAMADSWTVPFATTGDPHVDDASRASFNSQISKVFKVEGKQDLYIAMADRWVPGWPVDAKRADILERSIASHYEPDQYSATPEEQKLVMDSPMLESADTSVADYVWLPLRFEGDKVKIDWHESWKIEDYK